MWNARQGFAAFLFLVVSRVLRDGASATNRTGASLERSRRRGIERKKCEKSEENENRGVENFEISGKMKKWKRNPKGWTSCLIFAVSLSFLILIFMKKKSSGKIRVDFRKNRLSKTRKTDVTREFHREIFDEDETLREERISGKGSMTRQRTILVDTENCAETSENSDGEILLAVTEDSRPGLVLRVHGLNTFVEDDETGQIHVCAVRRLLKTLATDQRHVVVAGDRVLFRIAPGNGRKFEAEPAGENAMRSSEKTAERPETEPADENANETAEGFGEGSADGNVRKKAGKNVRENANGSEDLPSGRLRRERPTQVKRFSGRDDSRRSLRSASQKNSGLESEEGAVATAPEGIIERIEPRRGCLSRTSWKRRHVIVANVDQLLIVTSLAEPTIKWNLIDRMIIMAEKANIRPIICVNKIDLGDPTRLVPDLGVYGRMGYETILVSARTGAGIERLRERVQQKGLRSVVAGQSGVGKSSLLNAIEEGLALKTSRVSEMNQKGRHTTTAAELIRLSSGGYVVDTPGIRSFDLWDVVPDEVCGFYRDLAPFVSLCRFQDCSHTHESSCAVREAVEDGLIDVRRFETMLQIRDSRNLPEDWE